jgi:hypothetical protein
MREIVARRTGIGQCTRGNRGRELRRTGARVTHSIWRASDRPQMLGAVLECVEAVLDIGG